MQVLCSQTLECVCVCVLNDAEFAQAFFKALGSAWPLASGICTSAHHTHLWHLVAAQLRIICGAHPDAT